MSTALIIITEKSVIYLLRYPVNAISTDWATNDTNNKKANAPIMAIENTLVIKNLATLVLADGFTFHIVFRAVRNCPNTAVAPSTSNKIANAVYSQFSPGLYADFITLCIAFALSGLINLLNWLVITPSTASRPKNMPASDITISNMGAIENMV
jgi:hypothetical protein